MALSRRKGFVGEVRREVRCKARRINKYGTSECAEIEDSGGIEEDLGKKKGEEKEEHAMSVFIENQQVGQKQNANEREMFLLAARTSGTLAAGALWNGFSTLRFEHFRFYFFIMDHKIFHCEKLKRFSQIV